MHFQDGYYCLGYASTEIIIEPFAVIENRLKSITLFPNPAKDYFSIKNAKGIQVSITNSLGQVIKKKNLNSDIEIIDVKGLDKGFYFVHLHYKDHISTRKLIINK